MLVSSVCFIRTWPCCTKLTIDGNFAINGNYDLTVMYILKGLTIERPVGLLSIPKLSVMLYLCCIFVCLLIRLWK